MAAQATVAPSATRRLFRSRQESLVLVAETVENGLIARILREVRRLQGVGLQIVQHFVVRHRINVLQILVSSADDADRARYGRLRIKFFEQEILPPVGWGGAVQHSREA